MKGKLLQKITAIVLVLCMTMVNFIFVATNAVYALSQTEVSIEGGNIKFDAYFKDSAGNKTYTKEANISEGTIIYASIHMSAGILKDARITFNNANFKLPQSINSNYVDSINQVSNEIKLKEITYNDTVDIEIPVVFEKQSKVSLDYFDKENEISLSGKYFNSSENGKDIKNATINTRLKWGEESVNSAVQWHYVLQKAIASENKVVIEEKVTSKAGILPKTEEALKITVPKVNDELPETIYLIENGKKVSQDKITSGYNINSGVFEYTKSFIDGNILDCSNSIDEYTVVYIYNQKVDLKDIKVTNTSLEINSKVYGYDTKITPQKGPFTAEINFNHGNIVDVEAIMLSSDVYKGFIYANSTNGTNYIEKYNIEVSDVDGINNTTLEFVGDNFKSDDNYFLTNGKTLYKSIQINKSNLIDILGTNGTISIQNNEGQILDEISASSSTDENGNVVSKELNIYNVKFVTSKPQTEGKLEIIANKQIAGNADLDQATIAKIKAIETEMKVTTNVDTQGTTAKVETELKEPKTEARLTFTNNNSNVLSTVNKNNVEFQATLRTGTEDTFLYKEPKLKIVLPEDVKEVSNITAKALYAEDELNIKKAEIIEENGKKVIYIEVDGSQKSFDNKVTEGIIVKVNAELLLNEYTTTKQAEVQMVYTNENAAGQEYTVEPQKVIIQAPNKLVTKTVINGSAKEGYIDFNLVVGNVLDKTIENLSVIGELPNVETKEQFEENLNSKLQAGFSGSNYTDIEVQYSKDGINNWSDTFEGAKYFKVLFKNSNNNQLAVGEKLAVKFTLNNIKELSAFKLSYIIEGKEDIIDLNANETNFENETRTEQEEPEGNEEKLDNFSIKMIAISGDKEVKDGDDVISGQAITYKYQITNTSGKDLTNVKVIANFDGANVFGDYTYQDNDSYATQKMKDFTIKQELETSKQGVNIKELKAGETAPVISFQVIVKEDAEELKTKLEISADDVQVKEITTTNKVNNGELKLLLLNNLAKEHPLIQGNYFTNILEIKNTTNNKLENIVVEMNLPKEVELTEIHEDSNYTIVEKNSNRIKLNVKELNGEETKQIYVKTRLLQNSDSSVNLNFNAEVNDKVYYSNNNEILAEKLNLSNLEISQTVSPENGTVKTGDKVTYTFVIKNNEEKSKMVTLYDVLPEATVLSKISYKQGEELVEVNNLTTNTVYRDIIVDAGEELEVNVEAYVNASKAKEDTIVNTATISGDYFNVTSNEVTLKVEKAVKPEDESSENGGNQASDEQGENTPATLKVKNSISGIAWLDENKNGIRESAEKTLSGITVMLANTKTGEFVKDEKGNKLSVKTSKNGQYSFEEIEPGKYMVVFEYDNVKYRNTDYKVAAATESTNSDIITSKINVENSQVKYGVTDTLELKEESLENIDAGFIENEIFDLSLNKYISKVTVQNASGTVVKQYDKEQLAKIEIDAKNLASSTVLIEYTIEVKNEGELAGYANEIVDYMPKDLSFSSEINKNWYKSTDGNIHTTALSKELINPGEVKTITITFTKTMTENNTGTTTNKAEIVKSSNELSIPDKDSIAANNLAGEDDISSAELIISIRTGIEFTIGIIVAIVAITATGIIVYTKKRKGVNHHE